MDERERHLVEDLVTRARAGDPEAFSRLHERYSPKLTRYLRQLIRDYHHTEDVLQTVWLEAWRDLGDLRNSKAFRVWLYRIAYNKAMSLLRSVRFFTPLDGHEEAFATNSEEPNFYEDELALLLQSLDNLHPLHRKMIELRFVENKTYKQIAEITECNLGTVGSRLHRAKRKLRRESPVKR